MSEARCDFGCDVRLADDGWMRVDVREDGSVAIGRGDGGVSFVGVPLVLAGPDGLTALGAVLAQLQMVKSRRAAAAA